MTEQDCPFCRIVAGEDADQVVDEDERTVAFLVAQPATRGHVVVVPRRHVRDLLAITDEELGATVAAAKRVAGRAIGRLGADGVNVINGCGRAAWQTVQHFHIHVIPRYKGEPLPLGWRHPGGGSEEISAVAAQLKGPRQNSGALSEGI